MIREEMNVVIHGASRTRTRAKEVKEEVEEDHGGEELMHSSFDPR